MQTRLPLLVILGLYLALGIGYSLATPVGEGPDEPGHLAFIGFLVAHHRLPRYGDSEGPLAAQIKHPPLYYLAGAAATFWADLDGLVFPENPHFSVNLDHIASPAAHAHGPGEHVPYTGRYLAARVVRWLTVLAGLLAVWATWGIARALWPGVPALALGSTAVIAFLPQFLFMQGVVNNDGLANPLAALALLVAVRIALGHTERRDLAALGILLGLALLTKLTVVAMVAVGGIAVLVAAYRARAPRLVARAALYAGGPMLILTGWWFVRNLRLNGDLTGWGKWTAGAESLRKTPLAADLPQYFVQQFQSFWGRFGWMTVPLPGELYTGLRILTLVALAGLVWLIARTAWGAWVRRGQIEHGVGAKDVSPRWPDGSRPHPTPGSSASAPPPPGLLASADARWGLVLLVVTVVLVYISIFRLAFTWDLVVAQGRYLFTALPAAAILFALGLAAWFPPRLQPGAMFGLAAGMFALAAYALFGVLTPAFSPPPRLGAASLAAIQHAADVRYGRSIRLLGYDLDRERFAPGETVRLTTYWQADQTLDEGYMQFAQVLDGEGQVVGQVDRIPLDGRYPTVSWLPDRPFRDAVEIPFADWAAPGQASVIIGWYRHGHPDERLPATEDGRPVQPFGDAFTIPIEIAAESDP